MTDSKGLVTMTDARTSHRGVAALAVAVAVTAGFLTAAAQVKTTCRRSGRAPAIVERIKIHGRRSRATSRATPSIATRSCSCRRATTSSDAAYPVVYALHGYSIGAEQWSAEIHVPQTIEGAFAKGRMR